MITINPLSKKMKIGIVGEKTSGKTVFLTSLLWHLRDCKDSSPWSDIKNIHFPDEYKLRKKEKFIFPYEDNINSFVKEKQFPNNTVDFSYIDISYTHGEHRRRRYVSFVDIPGERTADLLMWTSKDYQEWSWRIRDQWEKDPEFRKAMGPYFQATENVGTKEADLIRAYKESMLNLKNLFFPVTPSSFWLGTNGSPMVKTLEGEPGNWQSKPAFYDRKIWDGGEFIPLPEAWKKGNPSVYKEYIKLFQNYKKKVLKPLYQQIDKCTSFIFCIDIFSILCNGHSCRYWTKRTIEHFFEHVRPKHFTDLVKLLSLKKIVQWPKVAYVATKSDLLCEDKLHDLISLLKAITPSGGTDTDVPTKHFTCSAIRSTKPDEKDRSHMCGECMDGFKHNMFEPDFPPEWPSVSNWGKYQCWANELPPPPDLEADKPPEETHVFEIFNWVTEEHESKNETEDN